MARTKKVDLNNSGEFKHGTTVGENGEILYDAPVVIRDKADMSNYGITHDDCKYLHLGRSQRILVYFYKTICTLQAITAPVVLFQGRASLL